MVFVLLLIASLFLQFFFIKTPSLWLDEAWVIEIVLFRDFNDLLTGTSGLFHMLALFQNKIFTLYPEYYLKLIPSICGSLIPAFCYKMLRAYGFAVAFSVSLIVLFSPLILLYSQDFSVYTFSALFTLLTLIYFIRYNKQSTRFNSLLFCIFGVIAVNSRPQIFLFTGVLYIFGFWHAYFRCNTHNRRFDLLLIIFSFVISVYFILQGVIFLAESFPSQSITFELFWREVKVSVAGLTNFPNNQSIYAPTLPYDIDHDISNAFRFLFILVSFSSLIILVFKKDYVLLSVGLALSAYAMGVLFASIKSGQMYERYFIILQPAVVVYFAIILKDHLLRNKHFWIPYACGFLLIIGFYTQMLNEFRDGVAWKPDHKSAFLNLKNHINPKKKNYLVSPYLYEWGLSYYYINLFDLADEVELVGRTFDYINDVDGAVGKGDESHNLDALRAIKHLKAIKADVIFVHTRRGQKLLPAIQEVLRHEYNFQSIYSIPSIVLKKYTLKVNS